MQDTKQQHSWGCCFAGHKTTIPLDVVLCPAPSNGCRDIIPPRELKGLVYGDQEVGRQRPAHHQDSCSGIFEGALNVVSGLFLATD